jgi:hypothetical protein
MDSIVKDLKKVCLVVLPPYLFTALFKLINNLIFDMADTPALLLLLIIVIELAVMLFVLKRLGNFLNDEFGVDSLVIKIFFYGYPIINALISAISVLQGK